MKKNDNNDEESNNPNEFRNVSVHSVFICVYACMNSSSVLCLFVVTCLMNVRVVKKILIILRQLDYMFENNNV